MRPAPPSVSPDASLEQTFQQMREAGLNSTPVMEGGRLVGLITLENIGEFVMLRSAVEQLQAAGQSGPGGNTAGTGWSRYWMPGRRARG
jgi:predicted transcriptional regulator